MNGSDDHPLLRHERSRIVRARLHTDLFGNAEVEDFDPIAVDDEAWGLGLFCSMTMKSRSPISSNEWIVAMLGWLCCAVVRASRRMRAVAS